MNRHLHDHDSGIVEQRAQSGNVAFTGHPRDQVRAVAQDVTERAFGRVQRIGVGELQQDMAARKANAIAAFPSGATMTSTPVPNSECCRNVFFARDNRGSSVRLLKRHGST